MSWISEVTAILVAQSEVNRTVAGAFDVYRQLAAVQDSRITALEERLAALEKPPAPTLPTVSEWIAANMRVGSGSHLYRAKYFRGIQWVNSDNELPCDVFDALRGPGLRHTRFYDTPADARAALADALIRLGKARPDMPEPK